MKALMNLLFILACLSLFYSFSASNLYAATDPDFTSSCGCDGGESCWWKLTSGSCPNTAYPYCIEGKCYDKKNDVGQACGESEDCINNFCQSDNTCGNTGDRFPAATATPTSALPQSSSGSCDSLNSQLSANNQYARCTISECNTSEGEVRSNTYTCSNYRDPETKQSIPQNCCYNSKVGRPLTATPTLRPGEPTPTRSLSRQQVPTEPTVKCNLTGQTCGGNDYPTAGCNTNGNNWSYSKEGDDWCRFTNQNSASKAYCYTCTDAGIATKVPPDWNDQIPPTKSQFPCQFQNGVKEYLGSFCGDKSWNTTGASNGTFCSLTYTDRYMCNDGKQDNFAPAYSAGQSPCAQSPWCKAASSVTPSDAPNAGSEGAGCYPSKESTTIKQCRSPLFCRVLDDAKDIGRCEYPTGYIRPTATPGTSNNCSDANKGNWGIGCKCENGGCNTSLDCKPEAENGTISSGPYYCAPFGTTQLWCAKSQTLVSSATACKGATQYVTPTPNKDYQAQCPNDNGDGTTNICDNYCKTGFTARPSGDQVCNEFTSGQYPKCCTQQKVGANTPTPTRAFTASTPTPTPLSVSSSSCEGANYQCQAGESGTENETCVDGWSNVGKRNCTLNTTCCQKQ